MSHTTNNYQAIKYFKMNSFRLGKLPEIQESLESLGIDYSTCQWVLQEKLHGSNSCFIHEYLDGEPDIKLGRRNGLVPEKEFKSFFNIESAYQPYYQSLTALAEAVCYERGLDYRNHRVVIYSELYGNNIQKGMKYHDRESIAVFDIRIDNLFLSLEEVERLCFQHSLPLAPLVMKGTIDELVAKFRPYIEDMVSLVPRCLHETDVIDAPAEGVIIRPYNLEETYNPDDTKCQMLRYKWKKLEFSERPVKKEEPSLEGDKIELLISSAAKFVNMRRLETYCSKVSNMFVLDKKNIGQNIKALVDDAMVDIQEEEDYQIIFQNKEYTKKLRNMMNKEASKVIQTFQFEFVVRAVPEKETRRAITIEALEKIEAEMHKNKTGRAISIEELAKMDSDIDENQTLIDKLREQVLKLQNRAKQLSA